MAKAPDYTPRGLRARILSIAEQALTQAPPWELDRWRDQHDNLVTERETRGEHTLFVVQRIDFSRRPRVTITLTDRSAGAYNVCAFEDGRVIYDTPTGTGTNVQLSQFLDRIYAALNTITV